MADTFSTNLNLTKPEVGSSTDTWGTKLNTQVIDPIDAIFSATGTEVNVRFNSANFDDNKKALFGTGDDLEIYHDGSNSYIKDAGTGRLNIQSATDFLIGNADNTQNYIYAQESGYVRLYHSGSTKLETSSSGVSVTGDIAVTGNVDGVDVASIGSTVAGLSTVATSGAYSDLSGLPTIPTNNNQLSNGAGYTTYSANQSLNTTNSPTFAQIYANDWFRANGNTGIYWQTHGRGWTMTDSSWIRTYGAVGLYVTNGQILATSNITAYYSDERLKDKVGKIENALDKVSQIETFYFKENELAKSFGHDIDKVQVGVSAQSVKKVLPEIVDLAPFDMNDEMNGSKSGEDYMTVDYAKLTPLLIEAIKELKAEIKELKG